MASNQHRGPSEEEANELHSLVMEAMQTELRAQMIKGKVDNALIRNILTHLKNMNVKLTSSHNKDILSLRDAIAALDKAEAED